MPGPPDFAQYWAALVPKIFFYVARVDLRASDVHLGHHLEGHTNMQSWHWMVTFMVPAVSVFGT